MVLGIAAKATRWLLRVSENLLDRLPVTWNDDESTCLHALHLYHAVLLHRLAQREAQGEADLVDDDDDDDHDRLQQDALHQWRLHRLALFHRRLFHRRLFHRRLPRIALLLIVTVLIAALLPLLLWPLSSIHRALPWPSVHLDQPLPPPDPYVLWLSSLAPRYSLPWLVHHSPIPHIIPPGTVGREILQRDLQSFLAMPRHPVAALVALNGEFTAAVTRMSPRLADLSHTFPRHSSLASRWPIVGFALSRFGLVAAPPQDLLYATTLAYLADAREALATFTDPDQVQAVRDDYAGSLRLAKENERILQSAPEKMAFDMTTDGRWCEAHRDEEKCRMEWAHGVRALYGFKSWLALRSINSFVAMQRFEATLFFANQIQQHLGELIASIAKHDTPTMAAAIDYVDQLFRSTGAHASRLHHLGYNAGLYASKHIAYHYNSTTTRRAFEVEEITGKLDFLTGKATRLRDFATCIANFGQAVKIGQRGSPFPSQQSPSYNDYSGLSHAPYTCLDVVLIARYDAWVRKYLDSIHISPDHHVENDRLRTGHFTTPYQEDDDIWCPEIKYPTPTEPDVADWNREIHGEGLEDVRRILEPRHPAGLYGKGLRRGNTPDGVRMDWWNFRKPANGERCLIEDRVGAMEEIIQVGRGAFNSTCPDPDAIITLVEEVVGGRDQIWCVSLPWERISSDNAETTQFSSSDMPFETVHELHHSPSSPRHRWSYWRLSSKATICNNHKRVLLSPEDRFMVELYFAAIEEHERREYVHESWN